LGASGKAAGIVGGIEGGAVVQGRLQRGAGQHTGHQHVAEGEGL